MNKMTVIQLLNKIANGEKVPKKIRIDHWRYKFEWVEHDNNYYDKHEDIDLMSCLSMDKEEFNYEVHEIEEEKKIPEKLKILNANEHIKEVYYENYLKEEIALDIETLQNCVNKIIDYLKSKGE